MKRLFYKIVQILSIIGTRTAIKPHQSNIAKILSIMFNAKKLSYTEFRSSFGSLTL